MDGRGRIQVGTRVVVLLGKASDDAPRPPSAPAADAAGRPGKARN